MRLPLSKARLSARKQRIEMCRQMPSDKGNRYKVHRQLLTAQTCAPPLPLTTRLSAKEKGSKSYGARAAEWQGAKRRVNHKTGRGSQKLVLSHTKKMSEHCNYRYICM